MTGDTYRAGEFYLPRTTDFYLMLIVIDFVTCVSLFPVKLFVFCILIFLLLV